MRGEMTHPDSDVLAEFGAGLLTGRRAAMIGAHLAGCPRCAATADELAGVSALLAAVPTPAVPDRVAQRLEVALAAEVALRNDSERASGTSPRARPARSRRPANRGFRWLSPRVLAPAGVIDTAEIQLAQRVGNVPVHWADSVPLEGGWKKCIAALERSMVERAMTLAGGNKSKAAEILGIHRRFLYEKLKEFGMTPEGDKGE